MSGSKAAPATTAVQRAIGLACWASAAIAVLALLGWQLDSALLKGLLPGAVAMNPVTAVGLVLAGASLWVLRREAPPRGPATFARIAAAVVTAIGTLKLFSLITGIQVPFDELLFHGRLAGALPNRMSPNTALCFASLGAGLVTLDLQTRRGWRPSQMPLLLALAVSLTAVIGHAYQAQALYGFAAFKPMAANSAVTFMLLSAGAILARPDRGLGAIVLAPSAGGVAARRLLPAALIVPLILGWLQIEGQRSGWFGLELGVALRTAAIVFILVALIWFACRRLEAFDGERKRATEALQSSLERQRQIAEANVVGVVTANREGWITEANNAFLQIVGYAREDLPLHTDKITAPDWRTRNEAAWREIDERGATAPFEKEYVRKDGGRVPALVGAARVPGTNEVVAFVLDLSTLKRAEAEAEHTRVFLDSVVENLPNMVFVKDARELRFVRFNRAGEELLGYRREDLIGKNDYDFFPKEQADSFTAKDRAVLESGALFDIAEEPVTTASGARRLLHTKKVPIIDERGERLYLLGISEDITEQRRAEQEIEALHRSVRSNAEKLEVANKELEAFSYSVSHDLRSPLRHINGFVELLLRNHASQLDSVGMRRLNTIAESAKRMGELIDDLLTFSRMGRSELQRTAVDLNGQLQGVIRDLDGDLQNRRVRWNLGPLPSVEGDAAMLRLALTNLISNAVKYTGTREEAVIEVGATAGPGEVVVFVKDNGVGFEMQYAGKLFGVFQRLHRVEEFPGTGIGLANVRRIVQRHGGRTWAEGAVDQGATFFFSLPVREQPVREQEEEPRWAA